MVIPLHLLEPECNISEYNANVIHDDINVFL